MTSKLTLRHYAVLFRCFLSVHSWANWLLIVGGIIFLVGVPLYMVWTKPIGFIAGGAILSMYVFLNAVSLPYQMLSIASSKQIGLLPNIRRSCFWMFVCACAIISGLIAVLIYLSQHTALIHSFFSIFVLVSTVLILNIVAGQKFPRMQGLLFLCFWALPHVYSKLLAEVHPIQLAIVCLSVWLAFYRHWLAWRPQKYQPNIFGMSQNQWLEFNRLGGFAGWQLNKFFAGKSNTLVGSVLLGRADGWKSRLAGATGVFVALVTLIGLFSALSDGDGFKHFMVFAGQPNFFIIYCSMAYGMFQILFRNTKKVWLYFPGRREDLFSLLERSFYVNAMSFVFPVLLVHLGVNSLLLDSSIYRELVWITFGYASITIAFTLYVQLITYQETKANLRWSGWLNILLMIIYIIPVIACNVLWVDHKANILFFVYCLFGISIVGIFLLRSWVKKKWALADLMRVTS